MQVTSPPAEAYAAATGARGRPPRRRAHPGRVDLRRGARARGRPPRRGLRRVVDLPRRAASTSASSTRCAPRGSSAGRPVYLLCRSGVRSKAAADALTAAGPGPGVQRARGVRGAARRRGPPHRRRLEGRRPPVASGLSVDPQDWHPQTRAVRGGLARSGFDETAEALYLTSGFVYESAEQAEAAFKDEVEHYIYSRYGNPTVTTFEERMRLLEGAEACFATASGMAAVFVAHGGAVRRGRPGRVVAGAVRVVLRHPRRDPAALGCRDRLRRRRRPRPVARGAVGADDRGVLRDAEQPDAGARRHRGGLRAGARGRRHGRRRQRLRHAGVLAPARARRRRRRLLGDQAHRRPGPGARRRGARHRASSSTGR